MESGVNMFALFLALVQYFSSPCQSIFNFYCCWHYYRCLPFSSLLSPSTQLAPHPWPSPQSSLCPQAMHFCSLANNLFTFFYSVPTSFHFENCQSVPFIHASIFFFYIKQSLFHWWDDFLISFTVSKVSAFKKNPFLWGVFKKEIA